MNTNDKGMDNMSNDNHNLPQNTNSDVPAIDNNNNTLNQSTSDHAPMGESENKKPKPDKKKVFGIISGVIVVIGLLFFSYWLFYSRFYVETEDAYVRANILNITPRTSGAVLSLHTDAPHHVKAGQLLIKLDDTDTKLNLELAKANLAKAVQGYCKLQYSTKQLNSQLNNSSAGVSLGKAKVSSSRSAIQQASIHVRNTKREYERNQKLLEKGSITRKEVDMSRDNYNSAQSAYNQAVSGLAAAKSSLSQAIAMTNASQSQYKSTQVLLGGAASESTDVRLARINFENAWLTEHRTNIYSPVAGQIAKRSVEVGEMIQAGTPVMSVVQTSSVWIKANFKETQLSKLRIGQPAEVLIDALGTKAVVHGKVAGVEAGTGTAFSLIPSENATGNWIKIVQRVPVRIAVDPADLARFNVGVGFSATVTVDVHDTSGSNLAKVSGKKALFKTDIYNIDTTAIDTEITKIINDTLVNTGGCQ